MSLLPVVFFKNNCVIKRRESFHLCEAIGEIYLLVN